MRAGRLRHMITIEQHTTTEDEFGDVVEGWEEFAKVRAGVEPLSGKEYVQFNQVQTEARIRFLMRYIPGVTADMRIKWQDQYFGIVMPPMNPNGANRELIIMGKDKSYE